MNKKQTPKFATVVAGGGLATGWACGFRSPVGAREFPTSVHVETFQGPVAHPSYTVKSIEVVPRVKATGAWRSPPIAIVL